MLQVIRPTGEGCIYAWPNTIVLAINEDITPKRAVAFNPAFYLFPSYDENLTIEGKITTRPSTTLDGENECFHINYEGTLIPKSQVTSSATSSVVVEGYTDSYNPTPIPLDPPYTKETRGSSSYYYTHIFTYGQNEYFHTDFMTTLRMETSLRLRKRYYINCASVYLNGIQIVCLSRSTWNSYADNYFKTLYLAYSMEYDPLRGVRIQPLTNGYRLFSGEILTPEALFSKCYSEYKNCIRPTGAFSWTVGLAASGHSPKGIYVTEDLDLLHGFADYADHALPNRLPDMGEMSYQCVKQMRTWDGNGIALTRDLLTTKEQVSAITQLLRNWKNPKSWASLFLSAKYGIPLTIRDLKELTSSILTYYKRQGPNKVSSSSNWFEGGCTYESHYGIHYEPFDLYMNSLSAKLAEFDLNPTYGNVWDLIPFSFVVDWFVDVGNYLDHLDAASDITHYNVLGTIFSVKVSKFCNARDIGYPSYNGNVLLTKYTRTITRSVFPPSVTKSALITDTFDHWAEGGAMIVQKILH